MLSGVVLVSMMSSKNMHNAVSTYNAISESSASALLLQIYSKPIKKPDFVFNNAIKSVQLDYDVDMFYKHCEQIYICNFHTKSIWCRPVS